jgi:hypothetical protein
MKEFAVLGLFLPTILASIDEAFAVLALFLFVKRCLIAVPIRQRTVPRTPTTTARLTGDPVTTITNRLQATVARKKINTHDEHLTKIINKECFLSNFFC